MNIELISYNRIYREIDIPSLRTEDTILDEERNVKILLGTVDKLKAK